MNDEVHLLLALEIVRDALGGDVVASAFDAWDQAGEGDGLDFVGNAQLLRDGVPQVRLVADDRGVVGGEGLARRIVRVSGDGDLAGILDGLRQHGVKGIVLFEHRKAGADHLGKFLGHRHAHA